METVLLMHLRDLLSESLKTKQPLFILLLSSPFIADILFTYLPQSSYPNQRYSITFLYAICSAFFIYLSFPIRFNPRMFLIRMAMFTAWVMGFWGHTHFFDLSILLAVYLKIADVIDDRLLHYQRRLTRQFRNRSKSIGHADNLCLLLVFATTIYASYQFIYAPEVTHHQTWIRFLSTLLIASPSSIYYAFKLPMLTGIKQAKECSVNRENQRLLYYLNQIDTLLFESTRALTQGRPQVTDLITFHDYTEQHVLALAYSLERHSQHPISKAISTMARDKNSKYYEVSMFQRIEGFGLRAKCLDKWLLIGNRRFMEKSQIDLESAKEQTKQTQLIEESMIFMAYDNQLIARFLLKDQLHENILSSLHSVHQNQIQIRILTGRNQAKADFIRKQLNIEATIDPQLLPHQKFQARKSMLDGGHKLAIISPNLEVELMSKEGPQEPLKINLKCLNQLCNLIKISRQVSSKQAKLFIFAVSYQVSALALTTSNYFLPDHNCILPILGAMLLSGSATLSVFLSSIFGWNVSPQEDTKPLIANS